MQGGSYIRNNDGSLKLVQRTEPVEEAKVVEAALDGASSSPSTEAVGATASVEPETKASSSSKKVN